MQELQAANSLMQVLDPDYYLLHYPELLPRYISHGRPTQDTLKTYRERIEIFLSLCSENKFHPLSVHDYQMRIFLEYYIQGHKDNTISVTIVAIRAFFMVAKRLHLIEENPCKYIHGASSFRSDETFKYFTMNQLQEIKKRIEEDADDFSRRRNLAIFYLMSIEGLRNVEVMRMNDEDIDWQHRVITIRGKGHLGTIYPSDKTLLSMQEYIKNRPRTKQEYGFTPTFLSNSNRSKYQRITRNGIRKIMDKILRATGYKQKGVSCHVFRHSCGTNLYAATKDLRVVQETLRQRDPKVSARYAHVQERMEKRYTNLLDL